MDRIADVALFSGPGSAKAASGIDVQDIVFSHIQDAYTWHHGMERTRDCDSPAYLGQKRGARMGFIPVIPSTSWPDASQLLYRRGR